MDKQTEKKRKVDDATEENTEMQNSEPAAVDSDMQPVAPTPSSSSTGPRKRKS